MVAKDVAETESGGAGLPGAEELAGAAELEVALRDVETVAGLHEHLQAIHRLERGSFVGDWNAVGFSRAPSHATAKLVKLGESEAIGIDDEHDRGVRHVNSDLDHGRRHEDVDLASLEALHRLFLLRRWHSAVQHCHAAVRETLSHRLETLRKWFKV